MSVPDYTPFQMYFAGASFSPDQNYGPGAVVIHGGNTYMGLDYSGEHALQRHENFDTADDTDWDVATDGSVWNVVGTDRHVSTIASGVGIMTLDGSGNADTLALGDPTDTADVEILVEWSASSTTSGHTGVGPSLQIREDVATGYCAELLVDSTGHYTLKVHGESDYTAGTWAGASRGTILLTRFRAFGDDYSARTWVKGTAEPTDWDFTHTQSSGLSAGSVGVSGSQLTDDTDKVQYRNIHAYELPLTPDNNSDQFLALS